eukprot:m.108750 g.108750  ORF g.108750 m.108750 type:complete len:254 (-) comp27900_c0_seq1:301-1062(-)
MPVTTSNEFKLMPAGHDYAAMSVPDYEPLDHDYCTAQDYATLGSKKFEPVATNLPSRQRWYVGSMTRTACETAVAESFHGDFLVRCSNSSNSEILCLNDHGDAVNFSVMYTPEGLLSFVNRTWKSLDEVIEYLMTNALKARNGEPLYLHRPALLVPWYLGSTSQDIVTELVLAGKTGDFLVRKSSDQQKYKIIVRTSTATSSLSLKRDPLAPEIMYNGESFDTLEAVIDNMRQFPIVGLKGKEMCLMHSAHGK